MKKLIILLMLVTCGIGMGWAQTTIGLTQPLDETAKTVGEKTWTGMDNVTITKDLGSAINDRTDNKSVQLNGVAYSTPNGCWRKTVNGSYDNQYLGYTLSIANGYSLSISKVDARILVADDTYNWYVEILDATNKQLYKSKEKTTKKASTQSLSETVTLTGITGTAKVRLYVKQGGSTKYFVADKLTVQAQVTVDERTSYTVTTSCNPENGGTVTPSGETSFVEGSDVALTAQSNTGYKFINWTIDGTEYSDNPYTISSISANHTAVANFEALPKISFAKGSDAEIIGDLPATDYVEKGQSYTLPVAYHLTKGGHTLTAWNDGTKDYAVGEQINITGDITLTPVFTANTVAFGDADATVNWPLSQNNGAPSIKCEKAKMYYVQRATINGTAIDAVMHIDASSGKFDNSSDVTRAQVNSGTVFTIPACTGMVVTITCTGTPATDAFSFNGNNADAVDTKAKTITYTYTGTVSTLTIMDMGKNQYPSMLSVKYPAPKSYTLAAKAGYYHSLYLDYNAVIPEGVTAYTGTLNSEETTINLTKIDGNIIPANTGVVVKADAAGDKVFEETSETATVDAGSLKGVLAETVATELAQESKVVLTLGINSEGTFGFRKPAGGKIGANKIYLLVSEAAAAKGISMSFDDETTGISEVNTENADNNAATYDLTGRRVNAGAKGLLIRNGKKFIVK
ncbi:MAG: hypothetical protein J6B91_11500 [Prevotella sp.]|nr:hypothetical protein [Prevotella sp.]